MLINKNMIIDISKMRKKSLEKIKHCERIDDEHIEISQKEYVQLFPDNRKNHLEIECDRCHKIFFIECRAYKEIDGKCFCSGCKTSMTLLNPEKQKQIKDTCLKKYGVEHVLSAKEIRNKIDKTNIERYGVKNPLQRKDIQEKMRNNNIKKYGVPVPSQSEQVKRKSEETCMKKYGVKHVLSYKPLRKQMEENNLKKYGVRINSQREDAKEKIKKTCLEKYGYENACQNPEVRQKQIDTALKKRGKHKMSSQYSRKLGDLFNGKIERACLRYVMDVYLEDEKIDIEYDGGGHLFGVYVFKKFTLEEFYEREHERDKKLFEQKGIKIVRFIAPHDRLPDDDTLLQLFEKAKELLNDNNYVVRIYLEN